MSDQVEFKVRLDVSAKGEAIVTDFCVQHLRERGYHVAESREHWETPSQFNKRIGVCKEAIHRALRRPNCPNVVIQRTTTGRIRELLSNAPFEAFVKRYKSPR